MGSIPEVPPRKRTARACDNCRRRKTKCDGKLDCSTCEHMGLTCSYGNQTRSSRGPVYVNHLENKIRRLHKQMRRQPDSVQSSPDEGEPAKGPLSSHDRRDSLFPTSDEMAHNRFLTSASSRHDLESATYPNSYSYSAAPFGNTYYACNIFGSNIHNNGLAALPAFDAGTWIFNASPSETSANGYMYWNQPLMAQKMWHSGTHMRHIEQLPGPNEHFDLPHMYRQKSVQAS